MSTERLTNNEMFQNYFDTYVATEKDNEELEVRFATKGLPLTKVDLDNIVNKVSNNGFVMESSDDYTLKVQTEYVNKHGETRMSNIRVEIRGLFSIQMYCKTNSITIDNGTLLPNVYFMQKTYKKYKGENLRPVDFTDYNFRVSYQEENYFNLENNEIVKGIVKGWSNLRKTFRLVKRTSFIHPELPYRVDCSIVKSSQLKKNGQMKAEFNFLESNIHDAGESYELEIEAIKEKFTKKTQISGLKQVIKVVLCGLQQSNYPIKESEKKEIIQGYLDLVYVNKPPEKIKVGPRSFIGPSSVSLELENIRSSSEKDNIENITKNYTVTDKADGIRKLLYIHKDGKVYLIDMNMKVQFMGTITNNKSLYNSIYDGEHILFDKKGNFINLFACFDIYFDNKKDLRSLPLVDSSENSFRLKYLQENANNMRLSGLKSTDAPMTVKAKDFYAGTNIFLQCKKILEKEEKDQFIYEIDGLIFTPAYMGVGIESGKQPINTKRTWTELFKWKPQKYNTVDFLVTTKKDKSSSDIISNIFENGTTTTQPTQLTQYKTLELRVGFDEKKHGYLNPCLNIIEDNYPRPSYNENNYKPALFYPTNPSTNDAHICKIALLNGSFDNKVMFIEDKTDVIEDNTIIECRYDANRQHGFKWIPIRVRHDKTYEYKRGYKNYGNAYHVANSVWKTIHNPITYENITTGKNIPDKISDDNLYYNRGDSKSVTQPLRNFHNLFVKKTLITRASKPGNTLIDTSVGKAGDMSKWISAELSFVFGVDISHDNIYNKMDGACARYVKTHNKYRNKQPPIFDALFVQGNTEYNIHDTSGIIGDRNKQITTAVFGQGPKDMNKLGKGVYKSYGRGLNGFDVVSCQFAFHYFFKNESMLNGFLRNVSECCKVGGYFIGTCYDGNKLFNILADKEEGEGIAKFKDGEKIWEVTKRFNNIEFKDDESSLGYGIDIYQESINKVFREYLVNFDYVDKLMVNYGFTRLSDKELKHLGLFGDSSVSSFKEYFQQMEEQVNREQNTKKNYGKSFEMTADEKFVSFLNNAFIYKKVNNVDSENIQEIMEKSKEKELEGEKAVIQQKQQEIQAQFEAIKKTDVMKQQEQNTSEKSNGKPKIRIKKKEGEKKRKITIKRKKSEK